MPAPPEPGPDQVSMADERVSSLSMEARRAQYESDTLALARDVAQLGNLYRETCKSQHAERQEKILHIRHQNVIGSGIVSDWMAAICSIQSGFIKEQITAIDRVWVAKKPDSPLTVM